MTCENCGYANQTGSVFCSRCGQSLFEAPEAGSRAHAVANVVRLFDQEEPKPAPVDTAFADVGGMDALKEAIRLKVVHPFTHPDLYRTYRRAAGGGLLLFGPPGCGKTFIARATAGECAAHFQHVSIDEVLDMYIGSSEKKLHARFEEARSKRPSVLFFDELDALAGRRDHIREHWGRAIINHFLEEMDGIGRDNSELLIVGATNAPWHVDPAFLRPGRFHPAIFVPPPDRSAREKILVLQSRERPLADVDFAGLARRTELFSGADLRDLCDLAADAALKDAMKTGKTRAITTADYLKALKDAKPTTRDWLVTASTYAEYATKDGLYTDLVEYLREQKIAR